MLSILWTAVVAQAVSLIVVAYSADEKGIALMRALQALSIGWVLTIFLIAYQTAATKVASWDVVWALGFGLATYVLYRAFVAAHNRSKTK